MPEGGAAPVIGTNWLVEPQNIGFSHLSLEYILIPVAAWKAGVPFNPSADVIKFAFMPNATQVPLVSDWQTGGWEANPTSLAYPYNARCLVGPAGTITLGIGTYIIYLQVTDSPEIPVLYGGQLQIS